MGRADAPVDAGAALEVWLAGAAALASLDRERAGGTELADGVRAVDLGGALGLSATGFRFAGIVSDASGSVLSETNAFALTRVITWLG